MQRQAEWWANPEIAVAQAVIPERIWDRIGNTHLFIGADPIFAGLYETDDDWFIHPVNGVSYKKSVNAHCCYAFGASDRRTTICIPSRDICYWNIVVHEYGHALHEYLEWGPVFAPITQYATMNEHEAFADAFETWITGYCQAPEYQEDYDNLVTMAPEAIALFEKLSGWLS